MTIKTAPRLVLAFTFGLFLAATFRGEDQTEVPRLKTIVDEAQKNIYAFYRVGDESGLRKFPSDLEGNIKSMIDKSKDLTEVKNSETVPWKELGELKRTDDRPCLFRPRYVLYLSTGEAKVFYEIRVCDSCKELTVRSMTKKEPEGVFTEAPDKYQRVSYKTSGSVTTYIESLKK